MHEPVPKQLRDFLEPGQKEARSRSDGSRKARYGSCIAGSSTDAASASELAAAAVAVGDVIDAVSEFSGIGALEHGLQAGMAEAGLKLRLLQASELDDTSEGRHNSSVLRKRFPHCSVLNPAQRQAQPYPSSARLLTVTTLCRHHSKMNPTRSPWETEDLLGPVFERLRKAPGIETVVMENVPEFVQILDLQERSSYTLWVEGLETCGFQQHSYALLPTAAAGDLHGRTRLISVHTRAGSFHPGAALSLMVDEDGDSEKPEPARKGTKTPKSFAFVSGLSQNRFESQGGAIRTSIGRLPAYNSNLNVVIFWDGVYYQLSPWLASRASALPDAWQHVSGKEKRKHQNKAVQGSALANMVSPLQARELTQAEEAAAEKAAARPEKPETPSQHTWMQCDACLKWRRMPPGFAPVGDDEEELTSWTCALLPIDCAEPEEEMNSDETESWRHEHTYTSAHDRWLLETADRLGATAWAAIKRASLRESAFTFDHFFRSRTAAEMGERLKVLLQNSSATRDEMRYLEALADAKAAADHEQRYAHEEAEDWLVVARDAFTAAGLPLPEDVSATGSIDASGEGADQAEDPAKDECELEPAPFLQPEATPSDSATTGRRSRRKRGSVDNAASTFELEFEDEFDTCGLQERDPIFAVGLSPTGERTWFVATVIDVNASRWPPVSVRFDATLQGETHPLYLPSSRVARLHGRDLASVIYAKDDRLCLEDLVDLKTGALRPRTVATEDAFGDASSSSDAASAKRARRSEIEREEAQSDISMACVEGGDGTNGPRGGEGGF